MVWEMLDSGCWLEFQSEVHRYVNTMTHLLAQDLVLSDQICLIGKYLYATVCANRSTKPVSNIQKPASSIALRRQ